jgi:allophanate hydrolase
MDLAPFPRNGASLLYEGAYVAERYAALRGLHGESRPDSVFPVTRAHPRGRRGASRRADAFDARFHRLAELRLATQRARVGGDRRHGRADRFPDVPMTVAEVDGRPGRRQRASLGTYTNFVNLLDLCCAGRAGAVPARRLPGRGDADRAARA